MERPAVLQLDSELTWRGGQNQVWLLCQGMLEDRSKFLPILAAPAGSELIARARKAGMPALIETDRSPYSPMSLLRLAKACRKYGVVCVDAHSAKAHAQALLLKRLLPELHLVVHRRVDYPPKRGWIRGRKYFSQRVDRYVAISEAIAGILEGAGIGKQRIRVVRSAINAEKYRRFSREEGRKELCERFGLKPDLPIIGSAGAFTAQKRYDLLVEALGHLKAAGESRWQAIFFGEGPDRDVCQELARKLGVAEQLQLPGFVKGPESLIAGFDIFALSSDFEGLGTILLEAGAAGIAIAATRVGGIPEIVREGKTGLLVDARDPQGMAGALQRLLADKALRKGCGAQAKDWVRANFSLESMVRGNLAVYEEFIA